MASQTITVLNAGLPVVQGIPFNPSDNLLSLTNLRVKDPTGAVIAGASAFEVMVRQYGLKTDTSKPIWNALVGFKPTTAGTYTIDDSGAAYTPTPPTVTDGASTIRVQAGGVDVILNKTSADLISSFKIGAAEQLHATNRPRLSAPVTIYQGLSKVTAQANTGQNQVVVQDGTQFSVGNVVKFYWTSTVRLYYPTTTPKPVLGADHPWGQRYSDPPFTNTIRNVIVARGTAQEQSLEAVLIDGVGGNVNQLSEIYIQSDPAVDPEIGQTIEDEDLLDDFTANGSYTITAISGNTLTLNRNVSVDILQNSTIELTAGATANNTTAHFTPSTTIVERQLEQHVVLMQRGYFKVGALTMFPSLEVTVRYEFYKDAPFIKIVPRFRNYSSNNAVSAQDATFDQLYFLVPTATAGSGTDLVTTDGQAVTRDQANTTTGTITAGTFKLSVPKFSAFYPKGLNGDAAGLRFDIFPDTGTAHIFPRDRAARSIFFLGTNADVAADGIGFKPNARLNPAHVVATGLYRLVTSVKPTTPYTAVQLGGDAELAQAANTAEKLLSVSHDLAAAEPYPGGSRPAATIREFRNEAEYYPSYGWDKFGIIPWADNPRSYNHYDTQLHLLVDWLRGAPDTGFERGAECAMQMADFGTFQSRFLLNNSQWIQYQGINFYENDTRRADPADGRAVGFPSHDWSGGLWTWWALTGDEATHEAVLLNLVSKDENGTTVPGRLYLYDWGPAGAGSYPGAWYGNTTSGSFDLFEANDGARWVGWVILNLMDAYRFHGDPAALAKAAQYISCFTAGEIAQGSKGYYMAASMSSADPTPTILDNAPGSFIWPGYCALGIIEYWRATGSASIQAFLLRVADHLMKGDATASVKTMNALLQGGDVWAENGNQYRPVDAIYRFWQGAETTFQSAGAGTINVANGSKLLGPSSLTEAVTYLVISNGTSREVVSYTGRTGNQLTGVVRGLFGTTETAWPAGTPCGAGAFTDGFGGQRATGTLSDIFLPLLSTTAKISGRSDLATIAKRIFKDIGLYRGVTGPFIDTTVATNRVYSNFRAWGAGGSSNKTYGQTAFAIIQYFSDVLNNPTPVLTSLAPNQATAGSGATAVTVTGTGFMPTSVGRVNGVARTTAYVSPTQLTVTLTSGDLAGAGTRAITVENPAPGGGISNALSFTVNPAGPGTPTISSIAPATATVNVATGTITVTGTNLTSASVTVDGVSVTPTSNTATQILLPSQTFASAGTKTVVVTTAGGSVNTSISVSNPAPTLSGISPTSVTAGAGNTTITLSGAGFVAASVVRAGATNLTTTYISPTQLTAVIPSSLLTAAGTLAITVFTATPGGGTSAAQTFTINPAPPAAPVITNINPSSLTTGGGATTVTITGTGFDATVIARVNGSNRTTTYISPTLIRITITEADRSAAATLAITAINTGSAASNAASLAIVSRPPIIPPQPNRVGRLVPESAVVYPGQAQRFDLLLYQSPALWKDPTNATVRSSDYALTPTNPAAGYLGYSAHLLATGLGTATFTLAASWLPVGSGLISANLQDGVDTFLAWEYNAATPALRIFNQSGTIATVAGARAVGDVVKIEVAGSVWRVWLNGAVVGSMTATSVIYPVFWSAGASTPLAASPAIPAPVLEGDWTGVAPAVWQVTGGGDVTTPGAFTTFTAGASPGYYDVSAIYASSPAQMVTASLYIPVLELAEQNPLTLQPGQKVRLLTNYPAALVTWSAASGNGTFSAAPDQVYTAPTTAGTYTVKAMNGAQQVELTVLIPFTITPLVPYAAPGDVITFVSSDPSANYSASCGVVSGNTWTAPNNPGGTCLITVTSTLLAQPLYLTATIVEAFPFCPTVGYESERSKTTLVRRAEDGKRKGRIKTSSQQAYDLIFQNRELAEYQAAQAFWEKYFPAGLFLFRDKVLGINGVGYFDSALKHQAHGDHEISYSFRFVMI